MSAKPVPDQARIVIIGGGAVGCAIAYHLTQMGERDVLVLEKAQLTHGATWHAAGLVGQLRGSRSLTRMMQNSVALMDRLAGETGQETGWRRVGSLRAASSKARWQEIRRTATTARSFGFEMHLLSAGEARDLFPLMSTDGVEGVAYVPSDGYIDPYSYTMALAAGARAGGAHIREGANVTALERRGRRIVSVTTDQGVVKCEVLVNAAGMWARELGALAGVPVPAGAVEHQYCVTDKSQNIPVDLPTFRDPDHNFYLKPEVGGLVIGGWEEGTRPFGVDGIPPGFGRALFDGNFDRFERILLPAAQRVPVLNELGIQTLINGPIPMSPDGEPVMGRAPELDNFYLACGFTAGVAASGGAGQAMAQWILTHRTSLDLWPFDVRRFGEHHMNPRLLHERCVEAYAAYYKLHLPGEEPESARGVRRSPMYDALLQRGAVYGSKFGWERPLVFASAAGTTAAGFDRPGWRETVGWEHRQVRENVALIDQTSFAKFEIHGRNAFKTLQWLATNDLDRAPGSVIYTQMCNTRGGIEADVTLIRLAEDRFYLVTGSGFGVHDGDWIRRHLPGDGTVTLSETTSARAVINICGPNARAVLQSVCDADLSHEAFPYMSARTVWIGYAPVLAVRITYVGELGWELHIPVEYAAQVYETLRSAGEAYHIADVGYRAIDSLRMEKRYLYWSSDISPEYTPYEAGLGFCVKPGKGDFLGAEALARQRETKPDRHLCTLLLAPDTPLFGGEAIWADERIVGTTTSGNQGYTVGKTIAFGYVPAAYRARHEFEVEAFGERHPANRVDRCPYDPDRHRILS